MHTSFGTPNMVMLLPHFCLEHEKLHRLQCIPSQAIFQQLTNQVSVLTHSSSSLCSRVLVGQLLITIMLS